LIAWFKQDGEVVEKDEDLFELETDKITMNIQAESAGKLSIAVAAGNDVIVGQVVGAIDPAAAGSVVSAAAPRQNVSTQDLATQVSEPPVSVSSDAIAKTDSASVDLSPAVRKLIAEKGLDASLITGTGKGGRILKSDVLQHASAPKPATANVTQNAPASAAPVSTSRDIAADGPRETRKAMPSLRRRLGERLVAAQQTAAILTTFNEVDMSAVMKLRSQYKDKFEKDHGVKLGFMSFFLKATVDALKTVPALNARIEGEEIVQNHFYDIGVAVSTPKGLVVPVVKGVDSKSFLELETDVLNFGKKARDGRIELKDLQGGCFTISNGGVFGSLMSTPILNPPQSGILGLHSIKKRPIAVGKDDRIEVRPMMYVAMSYDHRLVDGKEAVTFLKRVCECISQPERMLLKI